MKLLNVIKSVCLLVGIVVASDACAMEMVKYQPSADKFERYFMFMTLKQANDMWSNLSESDRQKIEDAQEQKNGVKGNLVFDVATKMIVDAHGAVAKQWFNGNEETVECFLKTPIKKIFEQQLWARDVYDGKKATNFLTSITCFPTLVKQEMFDRGHLFQYSHEINRVDNCLWQNADYHNTSNRYYADRQTLEALCVLDKTIKEIGKEIDSNQISVLKVNGRIVYRYYDTYTLANFLNKLKNVMQFLLCIVAVRCQY